MTVNPVLMMEVMGGSSYGRGIGRAVVCCENGRTLKLKRDLTWVHVCPIDHFSRPALLKGQIMRSLSLAAVAAVALGTAVLASIPVSAQSIATPHKKIFGYTDESGVFHPAVKAEPDATVTPTTGTIQVVITVALKTALPKGGAVLCGTDLTGQSINESTGSDAVYEEEAFVVATVSGATASCTVNVPYEWTIPPASSTVIDSLNGSYTVEMTTAAGVLPGVVRLTDSSFVSGAKIPATGTVSKYTVAATI